MLIGRIAELTGTTRKAIRHYEEIGLIPTPQRKGTYRVYTDHDVIILNMIRRAKALGFSLNELKGIVNEKSVTREFPLELTNILIDKKIEDLRENIEDLLRKQRNLKQLKVDIVKEFS